MKLKTFYKAMISAGVFLLFCTFPGADVKAGDTAENIYCNISYEYVINRPMEPPPWRMGMRRRGSTIRIVLTLHHMIRSMRN